MNVYSLCTPSRVSSFERLHEMYAQWRRANLAQDFGTNHKLNPVLLQKNLQAGKKLRTLFVCDQSLLISG